METLWGVEARNRRTVMCGSSGGAVTCLSKLYISVMEVVARTHMDCVAIGVLMDMLKENFVQYGKLTALRKKIDVLSSEAKKEEVLDIRNRPTKGSPEVDLCDLLEVQVAQTRRVLGKLFKGEDVSKKQVSLISRAVQKEFSQGARFVNYAWVGG